MEQEPLLASLKGEDVAAGRRLREVKRVLLDSSAGCYGCVVPKGAWHTVDVLAPSVIYEAKDGKYGEDGSETFDTFKAKEAENKEQASATYSNSLGDLKKNIEYLIGMER